MASIDDILAASGVKGSSSPISRAGNDVMGKDAFLQLLVAQMKYQDPLNPTNDKEFLAQMAQFSALEQMQNLNTTFNKMQGFALIGKTVIATQMNETTGALSYISGKVDAVSVINSKVYLVMGEELIPMEDLETVVDEGVELNPDKDKDKDKVVDPPKEDDKTEVETPADENK